MPITTGQSRRDFIRQRQRILLTGPAGGARVGSPAPSVRTPTAKTRVDLLIPNVSGPEMLTDDQRRNLLGIIEDRYERLSTILTGQLPLDRWYEITGNPTRADAILDRAVHNVCPHRLSGKSLRKRPPKPAASLTS
ncbi:ATP-binding protein [Consotaella sp. CSK11QG-6]